MKTGIVKANPGFDRATKQYIMGRHGAVKEKGPVLTMREGGKYN
jgi:hypothetical protein